MRAAGVETVFDLAAHAAMLAGVLSIASRGLRAVAAAEDSWATQRPDLCVLIDSPELNLRLASRAKRLGIPVLYYVAPQTWASRAYRNRAIARDVDHLACILPFEEAYFRAAGVRATYVGHPLFEALPAEQPRAATIERLRSPGRPVLGLLPGSRKGVIRSTLPLQLDVLARMRAMGLNVAAAISAVDEDRAVTIREVIDRSSQSAGPLGAAAYSAPPPAEIVVADNAGLLTAADLVLVASGTATLHVAYYGKPMIVLYDAGPLGRLHGLAKGWFITTPHLSLVNILAGRRVVPEFMPIVPDTQPVAQVAAELLQSAEWRERMARSILDTVRPLRDSTPSALLCRQIEATLSPATIC